MTQSNQTNSSTGSESCNAKGVGEVGDSLKRYFLFARVVCKKTQEPIAGRAPYQIGKPDLKMTHAEVIAFKNAMVPHPHLIHIIQEA